MRERKCSHMKKNSIPSQSPNSTATPTFLTTTFSTLLLPLSIYSSTNIKTQALTQLRLIPLLLSFAAAGPSVAQDLVLLLPLPMLIKLSVSCRSKPAILVVFSLDIFILITSCLPSRARPSAILQPRIFAHPFKNPVRRLGPSVRIAPV
jgi:hypothetical protein